MKIYLIPCTILVILGVMGAGCMNTSPAGQNGTVITAPLTAAANITPAVTVTQPAISIGDQYLYKSYSFSNQSETITEQLRIADPSWAIVYTVLPLSDSPQDCWFEMTVTNLDTRKNQTFTWTYLNDTYQQYPMYTTGPYQIMLTGNLVNVKLDVAKRLP